ncbi:hypothetical protein ACKUB1_15990 [Methanospirillum stamsii]|uniref:hypothetical protein n=1 Tax=Methanospirillum stamsii TaxID=1277351 RepID=UPI0015E859D7|nr:hypothetical protein [Methanospirillum stamsii]
MRIIGFKLSDYVVIALVELFSGDELKIICPDQLGISDTIRSFIEYNQRSFFQPVV